jgi:hypothetical protein
MPSSTDAGLAKRLAEAADTFRDGLYHYFVCLAIPPYDLHYTAGSQSDADANCEADSLIENLGSNYFKFGPYKTATPDNEHEPPIEYDSIQLKFMQGSTQLYCEEFTDTNDDSNVDVIILSISAYDKFFQPYYVRLYGIEKASDLRAAAVTALTSTPRQSIIHRGGKLTVKGKGGTRIKAGTLELG